MTRTSAAGSISGQRGGGPSDGPPRSAVREGTPLYLLDTYPSTLTQDPRRLAQLVSDIGWIDVAVAVGRALITSWPTCAGLSPRTPPALRVAAVLAVVTGQAHNLRAPQPLDQPGYILRQLWMQAAELVEDDLAEDIRSRLHSRPESLPGAHVDNAAGQPGPVGGARRARQPCMGGGGATGRPGGLWR